MKKLVFTLLLAVFVPSSVMAASDFTKLDADGNGQVTFEELTAAGVNWSKKQFNAADKDHNKTLSKAEYDAAAG